MTFTKAFVCLLSALLLVGCTDNSAKQTDGSSKDSKPTKVAPSKITDQKNGDAEIDDDPLRVKEMPGEEPVRPPEPDVNDPQFHEQLIGVANDYLKFGMVSNDLLALPNVAIADCAPARDSIPPSPQVSESLDSATHGKKLYFLFAKDLGHYLNLENETTPIGQAIVKEAWATQPGSAEARNLRNHASGNRISPRTKVGKETLEITKRNNLFIMLKVDPETKGTDEGWVYGVVTPDEKKVLASGRVASCANCHADAKHDRLFGPALASTISNE